MNVNKYTPPKLFLRFFRWYCHPTLLKHIEGDLMELYHERVSESGKRKADTRFVIDVLLLFRPGIIRPLTIKGNLNSYSMFSNYFKTGQRNLLRNKSYSSINIIGLAIGMSVTMLIGLWVHDELTFNQYHQNHDRIAQVLQHQTFSDQISTTTALPMPLGDELRTTYKSDFKHVVMSWWDTEYTLSADDEHKVLQFGNFMSPEALEMFSFSMLKGSHNSLKDPASIVLSETAAKSIFGDADPIGRSVKINNEFIVTVTGVYENFPHNSRFHPLQFLGSWDFWVSSNSWLKSEEHNWENNNFNIFVQLEPEATMDDISSKIQDAQLSFLDKEQVAKERPMLVLHPMNRWHLYSEWKNGVSSGGRAQFVWLFSMIGVFVLVLACINFINLSTARSERRAKEVGIRKSIGSVRTQLIYQFLCESLLVVVIAFVVTLGVVSAALPWFNALTDKQTSVPWNNLYFWITSTGFILVTSVLAGSYPALYLSSFQPVKVLKGTLNSGRFSSRPRKVLVTAQFTVSIILIVGTIVVYQQIQYAKSRPIGYTREGLIMIRKKPEHYGKFEVIKNALKESGLVTEVAESSSPATEVWFRSSGFNWQGKDMSTQDDFATMSVTHEYGQTIGWNFISGRDYSRDFSTDSSAIILNKAAIDYMGLDDPIGKEVTRNNKRYTIIGVIEDMVMSSPYEPVKQTIFFLDYNQTHCVNIRINPSVSTSAALSGIESTFKALFAGVSFDFKFVDQEYALKFAREERIGKLATVFATLAILISCLGLFGMSSYIVERRVKEIGVRKVLGASVMSVWKMLSAEFVVLVLIACTIAFPVAYYYLQDWLLSYYYHTEISWWIFIVTGVAALTITLLTVSYQTIRAAVMNPVKSLRSE